MRKLSKTNFKITTTKSVQPLNKTLKHYLLILVMSLISIIGFSNNHLSTIEKSKYCKC